MARLRLVHTADVHLGRSGEAFGTAAAEHRRRLLDAFERCVACCTEHSAQLLVIAGDLFDSPQPPESTAQRVWAALSGLASGSPPVPVVLAPGTHDPIQPGSIYERWLAEGLPEGVHLLSAEQPRIRLPHLDVAITFAEDARDLRPDPEARFNIGVIHGTMEMPGLSDDEKVIFTEDQLAASGMSYVALGHWHSFHEYCCGDVRAAYPGSPEIVALEQATRGQALVVDLDEDGSVSLSKVTTGALRYFEQELDLADFRSGEEIVQKLLDFADPDTILNVRLTGIAPAELVLDSDEMLDRVEGQFFRVRLADDSHPDWDETEPEPLGLVPQRFKQLLKQRFEAAASDEERQAIEQARSLGLALLAGREVLP